VSVGVMVQRKSSSQFCLLPGRWSRRDRQLQRTHWEARLSNECTVAYAAYAEPDPCVRHGTRSVSASHQRPGAGSHARSGPCETSGMPGRRAHPPLACVECCSARASPTTLRPHRLPLSPLSSPPLHRSGGAETHVAANTRRSAAGSGATCTTCPSTTSCWTPCCRSLIVYLYCCSIMAVLY
jgi:hypothetical protein